MFLVFYWGLRRGTEWNSIFRNLPVNFRLAVPTRPRPSRSKFPANIQNKEESKSGRFASLKVTMHLQGCLACKRCTASGLNCSLQNRRRFLRILGEWRRKGGEREARVAREERSVKTPACPHTIVQALPPQTHPQWPPNHSVRKTVVITARCGPNTSKVLEKLLVWDLK